jgi:hypothetical protein
LSPIVKTTVKQPIITGSTIDMQNNQNNIWKWLHYDFS